MGEPEPAPLDLELLQQGDGNEIRRAIRVLGLMQLAQGIVFGRIGSRYPFDVKAVALEAIERLFAAAIRTVHSVDEIRPMLATIATRRAINFVNVAYRKRERKQQEDLPENRPVPEHVVAAAAPDPYEIMRNLLVEGLGHEDFDLERIVAMLVELPELGATEEALLTARILEDMPHQVCADRCHVAIGGIGGRIKRLLNRIRAALSDQSPELREILRRNRELGLID